MADVAPTWREELLQDWHRYSAGTPSLKRVLVALFLNAGFLTVFLFRLCQRLRRSDRLLRSRIVQRLTEILTCSECHPGSAIGAGLYLPHPSGVVIGKGCVAGREVTLYQGVTLGATNEALAGGEGVRAYPRLGNGVILYPHVLVYGPVHLCDGVVVLGNSVVSRHLDRPGVYAGLPATLVSEKPTHSIDTLQRDATH